VLTAPAAVVQRLNQSKRSFTSRQMLLSPIFWLMYVMFVMVAVGGLMVTAQLGPIAKDSGVSATPVSILGFSLPALTFALSLDRFLNGVTRPIFGWISDKIGRENTMFIAFMFEGAAVYALLNLIHEPVMFVTLSGLVFFCWGEIYSLFPALCTDIYGKKFATTNYGLLYTAKGTAALLVPYANSIQSATGSWSLVFIVAVVLNITAAFLALFVLKRLRVRMVSGA